MGIELTGRVALVTGAANGIGRATALTFARAGAAVAAWDMAEPAGRTLVEEIVQTSGQATFFGVDVAAQPAVEAAVAATIERFGRIDILINNAGITRDAQREHKDGGIDEPAVVPPFGAEAGSSGEGPADAAAETRHARERSDEAARWLLRPVPGQAAP